MQGGAPRGVLKIFAMALATLTSQQPSLARLFWQIFGSLLLSNLIKMSTYGGEMKREMN